MLFFKKKLNTYFLVNGVDTAVILARSPERAKEIMATNTNNPTWFDAKDIEITITNKEQIIYGSTH